MINPRLVLAAQAHQAMYALMYALVMTLFWPNLVPDEGDSCDVNSRRSGISTD